MNCVINDPDQVVPDQVVEDSLKGHLAAMLRAGVETVVDLGGAKPSDKTLVDVLAPAQAVFDAALNRGEGFAACLLAMKEAAAGLESTRGMVARIGRASLLLAVLADGLTRRLGREGSA